MNTESLHFKIGLSSSSTKKQPIFTICVDGVEYINSKLSSKSPDIEYFEFDCVLEDGLEHFLEINFLNKLPSDTIQDDNGNIVDDFLLSIKSVEIDEIELGKLKWSLSTYYPKYPNSYLNETQKTISIVKNCVDLGWNGSWKSSFTCPYYIWLLENF